MPSAGLDPRPLTRTAALHSAVGSSVAFRACDVTSPFVQIQTFLTFCAKVSTETGLTVLNFAFWGKKTKHQSHHVVRCERKTHEAPHCQPEPSPVSQGSCSSQGTSLSILPGLAVSLRSEFSLHHFLCRTALCCSSHSQQQPLPGQNQAGWESFGLLFS